MNATDFAPLPPLGGPAPVAKLLVVDDHPANIQALFQIFQGDHRVFMATSGEQALAVCRDQQPDLVLLDVVMPGMDGYEVCMRLKADATTRDIPVIFVTSHGDEAAETQGLDVGAVDFITKPINPKVVRARVKTHLTLKSQSDLLRQLAFVDGLTGVANRRHFDVRFGSEWRRAQRNGNDLTLVMIDVDFFKRYNDDHGHQTGDDCLRLVAATLAGTLRRPGDLLARYGGEEFTCVLPETGRPGALSIAQQLEGAVRALKLPHPSSGASDVVTVSLGVAVKGPGPASAYTAADLLALADAKLYEAKAGGRARAMVGALPAA